MKKDCKGVPQCGTPMTVGRFIGYFSRLVHDLERAQLFKVCRDLNGDDNKYTQHMSILHTMDHLQLVPHYVFLFIIIIVCTRYYTSADKMRRKVPLSSEYRASAYASFLTETTRSENWDDYK